MNAKRIFIAIIVVLLSLAIALLPVISSFAEDNHGADAHSPSMSTEEEVIEASDEDIERIQQNDEEPKEEIVNEEITADAEDEELPAEQSFFDTYKLPIMIGGATLILIILIAAIITSNKKKTSKTKTGKQYHDKH